MSLAINGSRRCDWCGKLTRDKTGQYRRPDGTWGEIMSALTYYEIAGATPDQDCCSECYATMAR